MRYVKMLTAEEMLRFWSAVADEKENTAKVTIDRHDNQDNTEALDCSNDDESFNVAEAYISPDLKAMIDMAQNEINLIQTLGVTRYIKTKSEGVKKNSIKI